MKVLMIDPQNDFHELENSTLPVKGSLQNAENITKFLENNKKEISDIVVTLDTHEKYDIAHQDFWLDESGNKPSPLTVILNKDILEGKFVPKDPNEKDYVLYYTNKLEEQGKEVHLIWPNHCLKGVTDGWNVYEPIQKTLDSWEKEKNKNVIFYEKGTDYKTEHYGAFEPEVHTENSKFDREFFDENIENNNEKIVIMGQALSHCVGETVRQIIANTSRPKSDFVLLVDCTSPVPGFEEKAENLLKEFEEAGIELKTINDFIPKNTNKKKLGV